MKNNKSQKLVAASLVGLTLFTAAPIPTLALTKNETVYTKLNYDGSVKTVLVNEQLINSSKLNKLEDYSELEDILNINSDDTYTKDGNKITWSTNGKDIFYQGSTTKSLPISLNITYKLDGETMELEDMLGKKGNVTITLNYKNTDAHRVNVNGTTETLYTPFMVTLGTVIDGDANSNIKVTNGKVVSNGTKNIVVGIATPGLYESLKLSELKEMDTITISYDTEKFELSSLFSVVTPKVIDSSDLSIFNKMDSLYGSLDELQTNMDKIEEGSNTLKKGSSTLKSSLQSSLSTLPATKTSDALSTSELEAIREKSIAQVKSAFTDDYKESIGNNAWNTVKSSMSQDDANVTEIVTNSVTGAVLDYLKEAGEYDDYVACQTGQATYQTTGTMTAEQAKSCQVIANDTTLPLIKKYTTSAASNTASGVASYVGENVSKSVAVEVAETTAETTASSVVSTLAPSLANTVKSTVIESFENSLTTLYNGVDALDTGINELSTGISTYNKEGINVLVNTVNSDVKSTSRRLEALVNLGEDYTSFTSSNNDDGETKFVLVTDAKALPKETVKSSTKKTNTTLIDRIKNLFK